MSRTRLDTPPAPPVAAAYSYCETVTGQQARNFAYGIRLLPPPKRRAMSALYAFSRRVDDIGDGSLDPTEKRARLDDTRDLLTRIREDTVSVSDPDPVAVALHHAAGRFPIPLEGLDELIDGVLMDVTGTDYPTWPQLRDYCRCVAGAVGRLSLGVFGTVDGVVPSERARAAGYADTLGLALQLTNILRDLCEDEAAGRRYLPVEDLDKFGCAAGFEDGAPSADADFAGLMQFEVRRARELFDEGRALLPLLDRRSSACVSAMSGIYRRLLERIARDPYAVLRARVSLPAGEKAYVAARGLSGVDARQAARRTKRRNGRGAPHAA